MKMIFHDRVKEALHYDPETGLFIRKIKTSSNVKIGSVVGYKTSNGYTIIGFNNNKYPAHRLAWLYMTGDWPKEQIDHINTDKSDNRWCNLREANNTENKRNTKIYSNNQLGVKCVRQVPSGLYRARIRVNGKLICLGCFGKLETAQKAYAEAAEKYFGEFARTE